MLDYLYGKSLAHENSLSLLAHAIFVCQTFSRINNPTFSNLVILYTYPPMKMEQNVPKRRHIKFRRRGITQKKAYYIYDHISLSSS